MQGVVYREGRSALRGRGPEQAVAVALADPACSWSTATGRGDAPPDRPAARRRAPDGYWNQPKSHNAVAAAVAQGRADWGVAIAPVAHSSNLGFIPFAEEHYDFALVTARKQRPAVQAFLDALASEVGRAALEQAGFRPA